ncbi:unnamed protein product [Brachionus calyciflorus]|uniref:Uncharacterized protein n=1 Tax=Brachionus calyciflorus TaxID=104777 RepID=A0A814JU62_9BILA|nr:unnamed protein product [Brachionus calyciflorus]
MTTSLDYFRKYWKIFVSNSLNDNCPNFINYFYNQWLKSNWKNWKVFSSFTGYTSTNSPLEPINATIKRDFTHRRKLSTFAFIGKSMDIIRSYYIGGQKFSLTLKPTSSAIKLNG